MPIKLVEVSIIKKETIFRTACSYLGYEFTCDLDTVIMEFDDGTMCDTGDEYNNLNYNCHMGCDREFPVYIDLLDGRDTLFYKSPRESKDGTLHLNFADFKDYNRDKGYKIQPSAYNMIYRNVCNENKFMMANIGSNRYILGYEDTLLNRTEVIYLTNCIFKYSFIERCSFV